MVSNSKLTKDQKRSRKEMLMALPRGSEMSLTQDGVTVLLVPNGSTNLLVTSVASPDEQKIRRKVGQYHALVRWFDGFGTPVPRGKFTLEDICEPFGGEEWTYEGGYKIFTKE